MVLQKEENNNNNKKAKDQVLFQSSIRVGKHLSDLQEKKLTGRLGQISIVVSAWHPYARLWAPDSCKARAVLS